MDLRKYAAEGLAYLTLDAEVKENLCDDDVALKCIMELAKVKMFLCHIFKTSIYYFIIFIL